MKKRYVNFITSTQCSLTYQTSQFYPKLILTVLFGIILNWYNIGFGQSAITVFSENFDNATSTQPWAPYFSSGWFSPLNTLQSESGKGKVLYVNFPAGTVGSESGIGNYRIPLDSAYKELYLSWDYYVAPNFDFGWADNHGGGKFFGGFTGGSNTAIPNNDATDVDGWASIFMFQDGWSSTYNYFKGSTFSGGWPNGSRVATIVKGQWRRMSLRLKINDGDLSNGIFEVYDNNVMVYQQTNAKIVNAAHPEYLIEHIYLNVFFGGSGRDYASPVNTFMKFDNLTAFYFPKGSAGYRSGASEAGRVLEVPNATSFHPVPPNKFTPTNYTDAQGTISSHCAFYHPVNHPDNLETSTIQVSGATSISINVSKFSFDAGINYTGYKQILKIYQGTGTGKVLKQTFQNGINTTLGSVQISGNSATIEWQAGQGIHNGFSLNYTSNGSGSTRNFICRSCFARQSGSSVPSATLPSAPSNLTFSSLTDRSVKLSWNDNSGNESGFEIERTGPDNMTNIQKFQAGANITSYNMEGLIGNSTYTYKIRAYNSSGYSVYSNMIQVTTAYSLPNAPSALISTSQSSNSVSLQWTDNSGIENGFRLERSLSA
ncbi:MAG TPA: fibronectin type III domain-containing protein, partial [Bacteroidales bacterium]|nr:fibronectin type III domain-containing protein [Bacteroidales bacterium]